MASVFRSCFRCGGQVRYARDLDVPDVVFCVVCEEQRKDDPSWAHVEVWGGPPPAGASIATEEPVEDVTYVGDTNTTGDTAGDVEAAQGEGPETGVGGSEPAPSVGGGDTLRRYGD